MAFKVRMAQIACINDLTPHMRRIVLTGDDLRDFPQGKESAHVKVIVPKPGEDKPRLTFSPDMKKWARSYTVRKFDPVSHELTIDFAVNDHNGLVSNWALLAKPGDLVGIAGPGPTKHTNYHADWHLIVGDLTALPAVAATVEQLPPGAKGYVAIQIPTEDDKQFIKLPEQISLSWIINPDIRKNALIEHLTELRWLEGSPAIFIASESAQMREMKAFVKNQPGYQSDLTYASGYWKA